jgi:hypothetical protein
MRLLCGIRGVAVGLALVASMLGGATAQARPVDVHLVLRSSGVASTVITNSRYAFIEPAHGRGNLGQLVDEQIGREISIRRSGCTNSSQPRITGPWLVFNCASNRPAPQLYSLARQRWATVAPSPSIANPCGSAPSCCKTAQPEDAGSSWVEFLILPCLDEHGSSYNEFQSLRTASVRADPTGKGTIADLNSPALARQLCSPLQVPPYWYTFSGYGPGSVVLDGQFAVAIGTNTTGAQRVFLERCGTRLHRLLATAPYPNDPVPWAANRDSVVWQSGRTELSGVFLPSLHRFKIRIPAAAVPGSCAPPDFRTCLNQLALTAHRLYVVAADQGLWTGPSPSERHTARRATAR